MINETLVPDIASLIFHQGTPDWRLESQFISCHEIIYVIKGTVRYIINDTVYELGAGDLLCLSRGDKTEAIVGPDRLMECFSLHFILKDSAGNDTPVPFPVLNHIGDQKDLKQLFHELTHVWAEKRPFFAVRARGLFYLILNCLFELIIYKNHKINGRIHTICRYIARNYSEQLTVKQLAELAGLNPVYFNSIFKKETGFPVHQYLIRIRIKNAENMLRSGEYSITETADLCGYADQYNFCRQFKAIMGISPSSCTKKRLTT
jgi:AraC-like DNA-binding protein